MVRPVVWRPPAEPSPAEQAVIKAVRRAKLFVFLRLHRHEPGTLPAQARYLHQRTGGMIGSLLRLIRGAAIQAVLDGTEKITRAGLGSIGVDVASETADAGRRPRSST